MGKSWEELVIVDQRLAVLVSSGEVSTSQLE